MASFKDPSFQDRAASAAKAKKAALDQLRQRPPADEGKLAELRRASDSRAQELFEERAAKAKLRALAKAERIAAKTATAAREQAAADLKAARLKPASAEEMKAARDARYAARKARK